MKGLANYVNGNAFDDGLDESLIKEYEERNARKKEDEAWLKKHSPLIKKAMDEIGKSKADVNNYRVSVSVPDTSKFDMDKVLEYLQSADLPDDVIEDVTVLGVNEEALMKAIEDGIIDVEELKSVAWVASKGSPRLVIKKISGGDSDE